MGALGFTTNDEFETFKNETLAQIHSISEKIICTANESAELASEAFIKISSIENETKNAAEKIKEILLAAQSLNEQGKNISTELANEALNLKNKKEEITKNAEIAIDNIESIKQSKIKADEYISDIEDKISEIQSYIEKSQDFPDAIKQLSEQLEQCNDHADKIDSLLTHSAKKKGEIDDVYKDIFGEDIKSTEGIQHTDGMVDDLQKSYDGIEANLNKLSQKIDDSIKAAKEGFEGLFQSSKEKVVSVSNELTNLLPGAMAAGLSAAYEQKTADEISSLKGFNKTFGWSIFGLVCVSLIPFFVDIYLLAGQSKDLVQVIKDTPSLIVSILPLYFPVLWLAYSSNKKINLSKRLIEEYTHKAVLGKTFSGLSHQIESLQDDDGIKSELRTKLLFNVLQVSAENPGKLISNYQKSDHPLMEALENSSKLSDNVNFLAKIPGFSILANKLAERSEKIFDTQLKKVEQGLNIQDKLEAEMNDGK